MEKQIFEEEPVKKERPLAVVEVKLKESGEVLVSSSTDDDVVMAKILIDAVQGLLKRATATRARNIRIANLVNPNGVNMS